MCQSCMIIEHAIEFFRYFFGFFCGREEHLCSSLSSLVSFVYRGNRMVVLCVRVCMIKRWRRRRRKENKHNVMLVQYNWTHYLCYFDCDDHDLFVFTHLDWSLFNAVSFSCVCLFLVSSFHFYFPHSTFFSLRFFYIHWLKYTANRSNHSFTM